ncbi:sugar porter family MFS transporter [uncultured bacterium]|nr:sugar porter family MFS transporter [uncultured bacterium]
MTLLLAQNAHHLKLSQLFIYLIGSLGGLLFGFDTGIISGASPLIESDFHLPVGKTSLVTSSVLIGSAVGAVCIGSLSNRYGRKKLLQFSAILFLIGSGCSMFAVGFVSLVSARLLLGFAVGAASALTPAYLVELADTKHRGSLVTLFQLMIAFGFLLAYCANIGLLNVDWLGLHSWRWMLGSALIPSLLLLLGSLILPESPRYLVKEGHPELARHVLRTLRANTGEDPDAELRMMIKFNHRKKGNRRTLFKIGLPALLVAVGLMFFQQFIGINAVLYFLPQIFIKAFKFSTSSSIWISVGVGVVNLISTVIAYRIIDDYNRNSLLIMGSIVVAVTLTLLAGMNYLFSISAIVVSTLILIVIYIVGYDLSWGPLAWVMINEIMPFRMRGVGASIASATNWICDFIVSQSLLTLIALSGNNICGPFAIYAIMAFLSIYFVIKWVPETRGRSLEQIETGLIHNFHQKKSTVKSTSK